jgi:hypothetical protein
MQRHARQMRLAEVGSIGQAAIGRRRVDVCLEGLAADVAVRYLVGAGVGALRVRDAGLAARAAAIDGTVAVEVDPTLPAGGPVGYDLADPATREVARGARFALAELKAALAERRS